MSINDETSAATEVPVRDSMIRLGQLVKLKKQIHQHGGLMRLCGLNHHCQDVLRVSRLADQLHCFHSREEAVLGPRPTLPR